MALLASHQGAARAIRSAHIARELGFPQGEAGRRLVTSAVERLRRIHRVPVGAARGRHPGYYLIVLLEEHDRTVRAFERQLKTSWVTLARLKGAAYIRRLLGQLEAEFSPEDWSRR